MVMDINGNARDIEVLDAENIVTFDAVSGGSAATLEQIAELPVGDEEATAHSKAVLDSSPFHHRPSPGKNEAKKEPTPCKYKLARMRVI